MKIAHCCLAAFYIDNFSYQENILPRLHKEFGHEIMILASTETYIDNVNIGYVKPGSYTNEDGIPVSRLPYSRWLPSIFGRKLRVYKGLYQELTNFNPDIVFLHDCQFLGILSITRFARESGATIYVDCHTDFINSGRSFLSKNILHRLIYKFCAKKIEPLTSKFFPTLPLRKKFLVEAYGLPEHKMELLPFGVDDSRIQNSHRNDSRVSMRESLGIPQTALVFIAGGKIDKRKAIHNMIDSFCKLSDSDALDNCYLILFGKPTEDLKDQLQKSSKHPNVRYVGWIDAKDIHNYFWASDIAVFPGTHSVLWEEAVGLGLPCVFRRWQGMEHIDLGGNCLLLDEVTPATIDALLARLSSDRKLISDMRNIASKKGPEVFSYTRIAKQAIGEL